MKKLLFLSIFLLIGICSFSQERRFQAQFIAIRMFDDTTRTFEEWSEWMESGVIISITPENIHIYSKLDQEYTIIGEMNQKIYQNAIVLAFDAIDINRSRCTIELLHFDTGQNQMYIRWPNLQIAYQFKKL